MTISRFFFPKDAARVRISLASSKINDAAGDGDTILTIERFFDETLKAGLAGAPPTTAIYRILDTLHTPESVGETYLLGPMEEGQLFNEKRLVIKLPAPDQEHEFHRIKEHFEDESISLTILAGPDSIPPAISDQYSSLFGHIAKVLCTGTLHWREVGSERKLLVPILIEEYITPDRQGEGGSSLQTYIESADHERTTERWIGLAHALTNIVRRLHNRGILHGSIHPRHVIVRDWSDPLFPKLGLVGFGTSALLYDEQQAERVMDRLKTSIFAAPELREHGRLYGLFSYPADIYSVGMVLLCYAMGVPTLERNKELLELPKRVEALKRQVVGILSVSSAATGSAIEIEGISKIIDKCIRFYPNDRFRCADEMLDFVINAAQPSHRDLITDRTTKNLRVSDAAEKFTASCIDEIAATTDFTSNPLRAQFLRFAQRKALYRGLNVSLGHSDFYGSRDEILNALCDFMATLGQGARYCTVTVPAYWTDENLGFNGRFLVKNKDVAVLGVSIERIFLVTHEFDELPLDEQLVLWHQLEAQEDVLRRNPRSRFIVKVARVSSSELREIERRHNFVAFVKWPKGQPAVGLSFMSHGTPRTEFGQEFWKLKISKVRFELLESDEPEGLDHSEDTIQSLPAYEARFRASWQRARPIQEYIRPSKLSLQRLLDSGLKHSAVVGGDGGSL